MSDKTANLSLGDSLRPEMGRLLNHSSASRSRPALNALQSEICRRIQWSQGPAGIVDGPTPFGRSTPYDAFEMGRNSRHSRRLVLGYGPIGLPAARRARATPLSRDKSVSLHPPQTPGGKDFIAITTHHVRTRRNQG